MSKEIFDFTDEQIQFVRGIQYRGEIGDSEIPQIQEIYKNVIGVENIFCSTCNDQIAVHTNRLIALVEESIEGTLRMWRPEGEIKKTTVAELSKLSNKQIAEKVYNETGKKIHGNRASVLGKAIKILIDVD